MRRTPLVLFLALKRMDTGIGMLVLVFGAVGIATWEQYLPYWSPYTAFGVILLYGFLESTYEESRQVIAGIAVKKNKLRAYESRDSSRIVAELHEYGPVHMHEGSTADEEDYIDCWVPYETEDIVTTIDVGTLGGDYFVTLGHEARSLATPSRPITSIRVDTRLDVLTYSDQGEQMFRRLTVYSGEGQIEEDGSAWRYKVSCTLTLSDLAEGVYGFEVYDITNAPGKIREYRNMHLIISKLDED